MHLTTTKFLNRKDTRTKTVATKPSISIVFISYLLFFYLHTSVAHSTVGNQTCNLFLELHSFCLVQNNNDIVYCQTKGVAIVVCKTGILSTLSLFLLILCVQSFLHLSKSFLVYNKIRIFALVKTYG